VIAVGTVGGRFSPGLLGRLALSLQPIIVEITAIARSDSRRIGLGIVFIKPPCESQVDMDSPIYIIDRKKGGN
jgi:hypothetical protein